MNLYLIQTENFQENFTLNGSYYNLKLQSRQLSTIYNREELILVNKYLLQYNQIIFSKLKTIVVQNILNFEDIIESTNYFLKQRENTSSYINVKKSVLDIYNNLNLKNSGYYLYNKFGDSVSYIYNFLHRDNRSENQSVFYYLGHITKSGIESLKDIANKIKNFKTIQTGTQHKTIEDVVDIQANNELIEKNKIETLILIDSAGNFDFSMITNFSDQINKYNDVILNNFNYLIVEDENISTLFYVIKNQLNVLHNIITENKLLNHKIKLYIDKLDYSLNQSVIGDEEQSYLYLSKRYNDDFLKLQNNISSIQKNSI